MATVNVRYVVHNVDTAIAFYRDRLGFTEVTRPRPAFAMLTRDELRLILSTPDGGQATPGGTAPEPGGWNRIAIEVNDLETTVHALKAGGTRFRTGIVTDVGGTHVLVEDPSGNPVELVQPIRDQARLDNSYLLQPIGHVESTLTDPADAPRQGALGAPDAWLVIEPVLHDGIRDIRVGADLLVLTWLHRARRDKLTTIPGSDPGGPERGVFNTRSPARPNPVGLHPVTVDAIDGNRLRVHPLEAIHGTPLIDIKPVIHPATT